MEIKAKEEATGEAGGSSLVKDMPLSLVLCFFPLLVFGRGRDLLVACLRGCFFDGLKGMLAALSTFPSMLKKRKAVKDKKKINNLQLLFYFSWQVI